MLAKNKVNFIVEGRLTQLLGENYSSVEHALKELVDNAWDADAENVYITIPESLDDKERFILIKDDGIGMNPDNIRNEYLRIARDRVSAKGERTELKDRLVKGRKGIGKFAGLLIADCMKIITANSKIQTTFVINKTYFLEYHENLSTREIELDISENSNTVGTEVRLTDIDILSLSPTSDRLRQLLILEYGREENFNIFINNEPLKVEDVGGKNYKFVDESKKVDLNFNIASKEVKNKKSGIVLRVKGKIIGKPHYWGVDEVNYIHEKLLKKVYGEVNADFLEPHTTNNWGILESTLDFEYVSNFVNEKLLFALNDSFEEYILYTKRKLQTEINKQIEQLPEHKRSKAIKLIDKILTGLSDGRHSEQQIKNIISVAISALENDDYYDIVEKLAEASDSDVALFAEILQEFGLVDIRNTINQAIARRTFLDNLQVLADNKNTLESAMHVALENNMWVFGKANSLMSSNQTTKHIVAKYLDSKFSGKRANKRPDLLLSQDNTDRLLLIEFKRPNLIINRTHESQAVQYRDDLSTKFPNKPIDVIVIGKSVDPTISSHNVQPNCELTSFDAIISNARNELDWLISNLKK